MKKHISITIIIILAVINLHAQCTITGTLRVCVGSTTQLTGSGTPSASSPWVSATTSVATISNTGLVTGVSAGTSAITYTSNNGCINTATVTVIALPIITGTLNICAGSTTQLTGSGTPGASSPWVSATPSVATVNRTGLVTAVSPGTSVITYTTAYGCRTTATITVNALPTIAGNLSVCAGSTTQLTGSGTPAASSPWMSATASVATVNSTGLVTPVLAGISIITYTNNTGCSRTATLTVNALPVAPTISAPTQPTCTVATGSVVLNGLPATGTWTLTRNPGGATTTGTGTSTTVSGLAANTYTFTVTNASGCTSVVSGNVVINAQPTTPTVPAVGTITHPTCTVATGSVVLNGLPATGTWTITRNHPAGTTITGSGTSTTIPGLTANTYTFTVTNASGCTSAALTNVVINAQPSTPTPPTVGTIIQPACTVVTGSVIIKRIAINRYMDFNKNSWWYNQYRNRNKYNNIRACSRYLYFYSYQCFGMYFRCIRQCDNQCTTINTNGSGSREHNSAYLHSCYRKCGFKWFATNRYMDINKNSWWYNCTWNRDKYYNIRACSRHTYFHSDKCFRMHFTRIS